MENNFEPELKGTLEQAKNAQEQILKYFKRFGDSVNKDASKHQLIFAGKITWTISKCEEKHLDIYLKIITQTFGDQLKPECSPKYWLFFVNCIRYFHYSLVNKKKYEMAHAIYKYISSFEAKLQSADIGITLVNIYCSQFLLQMSLKSSDNKKSLDNGNEIVESLAALFKELLDTNKQFNFQYPDILNKTLQFLFPRNSMGPVYKFMNLLSQAKVKQMFESLFTIYGQQTILHQTPVIQDDVERHAQFIIETVHNLMQIDLIDKFQLQLSIGLLGHCRTEYRLQSYKPAAELLLLLHDYLELLCSQQKLSQSSLLTSVCERFKELFDKHSKTVMSQKWFGDLLVFLYYLHNQLQNIRLFNNFWNQISKPDCYKAIFQLFIECVKLAPYISAETKLFSVTCCSSIRKHVILSYAQIAIAVFVFYCQNVAPSEEEKYDKNPADNFKETIQQPLLTIVNHAFKLINSMDCVTSTSQDMDILLTRFKQATISVRTSKQAGACLILFELFLKIKDKIRNEEWTLALRRLYKIVTEHITSPADLGRDIQMCYIASMLDDSVKQIDIGQIRSQINIFYNGGGNSGSGGGSSIQTTGKQQQQQQVEQQHERCLMHLLQTKKCSFRPNLGSSRKKLLHWLESQHILKYFKSNTTLLHSLLKLSQSQYDFVLITRNGKLENYALDKISSICQLFLSKAQEPGGLRRLDQLTYGHALTMLFLDHFTKRNFEVHSKDLNEHELDQLLLREEMASITICNELEQFNTALEAFKAFEQFYEKFDDEIISMDDAIIDWECIIDDLQSLANFLQLSGYMEQSSQVWLLHFKYARLLQDDFSCLKSLTFFCEYSEFYKTSALNIDTELDLRFSTITAALDNLSALQWCMQNTVLLAVIQIAYYYARTDRYSCALMLLQCVEDIHFELPERQGGYDMVLATLDAVKFRLMWKQFKDHSTCEKSLTQRCLLFEMEEIIDRFHDLKCKSGDTIKYAIFVVGFAQELAECTANRLCDNFLISFLHLTVKFAFKYGLALRVVQVMSMWLWINLQMEYVDKAQIKLKIIEYVMGVKSLKELTEKCKAKNEILSNICGTTAKDLIPLNNINNMEEIRKLAHVQLSPIKTDKLQLSPSFKSCDLKRYFKSNIDTKLMPKNEIIEWTYFTVGCFNARLYFLVGEYEQLEAFYEKAYKWLQMRKNAFNKEYYTNIQLIAMQHYINFLRSQRQYEKALKYLKIAIDLCDDMKFKIDFVYNINFQMQMLSSRIELEELNNPAKYRLQSHNGIRKVLDFSKTPLPNRKLDEMAIDAIALESSKKLGTTSSSSSLKTVVKRKPKIQNSCTTSSASSSLDLKSIKPKQKLQFDISGEDFMDIIDSDEGLNDLDVAILEITDSDDDECKNELKSVEELKIVEELKTTKRSKTQEVTEQHKPPKVPKTTTKTTTAATVAKTIKYKRPIVQQSVDLTDSPLSTPLPASASSSSSSSSSSNSSLDKLETNENIDLVKQMKNLEIKNGTKPKSRGRKPALAKQLSAPLVILVDSPTSAAAIDEATDARKASRSRTRRDKTPISKCLESPVNTRTRRNRKLITENNENNENPTLSSAAMLSLTGVSSRRRKGNIY